MNKAESLRHLGNIVTKTGDNQATLEDRRNQGWGKVPTILGTLGKL